MDPLHGVALAGEQVDKEEKEKIVKKSHYDKDEDVSTCFLGG